MPVYCSFIPTLDDYAVLKEQRDRLAEALEASNKFLIGERDAQYDCCSDREGNIPDPDDQAAIDDLDKIIDRNQELLRK